MADVQVKQARAWWKTKRWWALGAFIALFATHLFPHIGGPSMSCLTAGNEAGNDAAAGLFASLHASDPGAVLAYMESSDFVLRSVETSGSGTRHVFVKNRTNLKCALLDLVSIDGSIVVVELAAGAG